MCGIIVLDNRKSCVDLSLASFVIMLRDSEDRGQDSTGVTIISFSGHAISHKVAGGVDAWLKTLPQKFKDSFRSAAYVLGVNRAQPTPEGDSIVEFNRQPIQSGAWVGVHNGTIGNDRELTAEYDLPITSQVDTEVAVALLGRLFNPSTPEESIQNWASKLSGGMTMFVVDRTNLEFVCVKNFKPLCYYKREDGLVYWASESKTLECEYGAHEHIRWVPPYTGFYNSVDNHFPIETLHETTIPESDPNAALVVTSGGIDSSTAAYVAHKMHEKSVTLLHFDYGQVAKVREWQAVCDVAEDIGCGAKQVDIGWLGRLADTPLITGNNLPLGIKSVETTGCWVPARNLVMLSIAAGICESLGIGNIYSGFNLSESGVFPDNDIEFLKVFNLALQYGTLRRPKLVLALERIMKPEIIKLGDWLGVPFDKTWSCDQGFDKPCGQCGCCWMRQFAFMRAGVEDTQTYMNPPKELPVWHGTKISETAPIPDIIRRVRQRGLEDLVSL